VRGASQRGHWAAGTASDFSKRQLVTIPGRRAIILLEVEASCHCIRGRSRVAIELEVRSCFDERRLFRKQANKQ
jgi:hypothetical protein